MVLNINEIHAASDQFEASKGICEKKALTKRNLFFWKVECMGSNQRANEKKVKKKRNVI